MADNLSSRGADAGDEHVSLSPPGSGSGSADWELVVSEDPSSPLPQSSYEDYGLTGSPSLQKQNSDSDGDGFEDEFIGSEGSDFGVAPVKTPDEIDAISSSFQEVGGIMRLEGLEGERAYQAESLENSPGTSFHVVLTHADAAVTPEAVYDAIHAQGIAEDIRGTEEDQSVGFEESSSSVVQPGDSRDREEEVAMRSEGIEHTSALQEFLALDSGSAVTIPENDDLDSPPLTMGHERSSKPIFSLAWLHKQLIRWKVYIGGHAKILWSVAVAAAVLGLLMLGRGWQRLQAQNRILEQELHAKDKKISQLMFQLIQMKDVLSRKRRIPVIRQILTLD